MAASLVQCRILFASTNCCKKHRLTLVPTRHASKFIVDYRTVDDEEEPFEDLRDVSRLSERLKTKLPKNAEAPEPDMIPPTYARDQKRTRTFQRRMFAKFGEKYAINPAKLWPTQEEIAKEKLRDIFYDIPLEESFEKIRITKEEKEENRRKRYTQNAAKGRKLGLKKSASFLKQIFFIQMYGYTLAYVYRPIG